MLKRLELIGFKSFAEKTRFDFPRGVTAIVGPNGSGKSNVVDAVRWILGEQSAKSLRGGEMADVIFNGSASRKSLGLAEVTMTFDNSRRALGFDADEVQITRRVYRDGTGEYLINNQMARLKDIKEMFLGSGAGHGAYSIIEQGRVDALLQASTKDRRTIFEEAAGISRFKARKLETLRKLENVDQNLARARDIIAEVDKQLRRVRLEASKAQRFQEYTARLRELRVGAGLREFGQFSRRLADETAALEELRSRLGASQVEAAASEAAARRLEEALAELDATIEESSGRLADARRRIAAGDAHLASEAAKADDLERQLTEARARRVELARLVQAASASAADAGADVADAETHAEAQRRRVAELEAALATVEADLAALHRQVQEDRIAQVDLVRQAGTLQTQADSAKHQLDRFYRDREGRRRRIDQRGAELGSIDRVLEDLDRTGADLQHRLATVRHALAQRQQERDDLRRRADASQQELADLQVRRSELRGRIETLEGLERSQEGLGTGVRELVDLLKAEAKNLTPPAPLPEKGRGEQAAFLPSPLRGGVERLSEVIIGLVADFLSVPREVAPLIDLALGDAAQKFVVSDAAALDRALAARERPFAGRVSFLPLAPLEPLAEGDETSTADRWVTCDRPDLAGLPRQLLGNVRIVPDLAVARELAADPALRGCRFVTRRGELLDADGTFTVGTHHAETGILSRKSELRDLRAKAALAEGEIAAAEAAAAKLRSAIDALDAPIHGLEQEVELLAGEAGDLQAQLLQHRQSRARLDDEITLSRAELNLLEQEIASLEAAWNDGRARAEEAEKAALALKQRLEDADRRSTERECEREERQQEQTAAQIALAQMEERLSGLSARFEQIQADLRRGRDESHRVERHEAVLEARATDSLLAILRTTAELASLHHAKESLERELADLARRRDDDREHRRTLVEQMQSGRAASQEQLAQLHQRELSVRDLENARTSLADRLREDYQIDLAQLAAELETPTRSVSEGIPDEPELLARSASEGESADSVLNLPDPEQIAAEINTLKEKIRKLGNVSLESLQELQEVEARAKDLQAQHDDLTSAQGSLMEIIAKINADSRRLFGETYEQIRTHFQELFRKLFGGGMADVVLENPEDVLESGIEIVARPPGKELRSISLMSGGEKTLTAVALLLAIFRSKPSPFCLLDEVDAALDEANTSRLSAVLREFLDRSQFIVITHKKRTMAAADVLYGITMQESGVSKQVAVRFEDWPEDEPQESAA
jgi:chromosome segregation protein